MIDRAFNGGPLHREDINVANKRLTAVENAYFTFNYTPVRDDDGTVCAVFCHCQETTAQVIARRKLNSEHERLKRLFEQAASFMALLTGAQHLIEFGNSEYIKLAGGRDVVGKTVAEAIPEAVEQGYLDLLETVF